MILQITDLHLGLRTYSHQLSNGLFTAEEEGRKAIKEVLDIARSPSIDLIVFKGDWFHTNNPTTENIAFTIECMKEFDSLDKCSYFIPGNHDSAMYTHSLRFIEELGLTKVFIVNSYINIEYKGWTIHFIPYLYNPQGDMRNRDGFTHEKVNEIISNVSEKSIIVSHVQEVTSKIGAESVMLNKGVDLIDINNIHNTKKIYCFLGHMHLHQIYKKGFATVCYAGSLFYHDSVDAGTKKGYCLFDPETEQITFTALKTIRKFSRLSIFDATHIEKIICSDLYNNQVVFIDIYCEPSYIIEEQITSCLQKVGSTLGQLKYHTSSEEATVYNVSSVSNPFQIFNDWVEERGLDINLKSRVLTKGKEVLEVARNDT